MKSFISFFLVLLLVFVITILIFLILLKHSVEIPVIVSEEIRLIELGYTMKSVNALLASRSPIELEGLGIKSNITVPIIDLMIAANFAKEQSVSNIANNTLYKINEYYLNKNISFGYCIKDLCYACSYIIVYPTVYGDIKMCEVSFSSLVAIASNCSKT